MIPAVASPWSAVWGPDRQVGEWFHDLAVASPALTGAAVAGAVLLHPFVLRLAVLVAAVVAYRSGRRRPAVVAVVAMAGAGLLAVGLKLAIGRPRPVWADPVATEGGFSMPSAHALNAAAGVGLLLALAWPWLRSGSWRRAVALVAAVAVVVLAAVDRLLLGVHYLSDVMVGAALGAAVAVLAAPVVAADRTTEGARR